MPRKEKRKNLTFGWEAGESRERKRERGGERDNGNRREPMRRGRRMVGDC